MDVFVAFRPFRSTDSLTFIEYGLTSAGSRYRTVHIVYVVPCTQHTRCKLCKVSKARVQNNCHVITYCVFGSQKITKIVDAVFNDNERACVSREEDKMVFARIPVIASEVQGKAAALQQVLDVLAELETPASNALTPLKYLYVSFLTGFSWKRSFLASCVTPPNVPVLQSGVYFDEDNSSTNRRAVEVCMSSRSWICSEFVMECLHALGFLRNHCAQVATPSNLYGLLVETLQWPVLRRIATWEPREDHLPVKADDNSEQLQNPEVVVEFLDQVPEPATQSTVAVSSTTQRASRAASHSRASVKRVVPTNTRTQQYTVAKPYSSKRKYSSRARQPSGHL